MQLSIKSPRVYHIIRWKTFAVFFEKYKKIFFSRQFLKNCKHEVGKKSHFEKRG